MLRYFRNYNPSDNTMQPGDPTAQTFVSPTEFKWAPPRSMEFREWNTSRNGAGTSYDVGDAIADVTVYAIWRIPASAQYLASGADITSVADAIRAKTGASYTLSFPDDFVTEIDYTKTVTAIPLEITPTTSSQYLTPQSVGIQADGWSTVMVGAISPLRSSADVTVSGAMVTVPAGYYSNQVQTGPLNGTQGEIELTKAILPFGVRVDASATDSTGYIVGTTKTSAITVLTSELVSGTKNIDANGDYGVSSYAYVSVAVPQGHFANTFGPYSAIGDININITGPHYGSITATVTVGQAAITGTVPLFFNTGYMTAGGYNPDAGYGMMLSMALVSNVWTPINLYLIQNGTFTDLSTSASSIVSDINIMLYVQD